MGKPKKFKGKKGPAGAAAQPPTTTTPKLHKARNRRLKAKNRKKMKVAEEKPAVEPNLGAASTTVAAENQDTGNEIVKKEIKGEKGKAVEKSSGFIFMCNMKTKAECYQYRVFGMPAGKLKSIEKIKPGTRLFLYDFDLRLLYGIYRATTFGKLNLEKNAFNGRFPAQVKFKIDKDCLPLPESVFKDAIKENYHRDKFSPELNSKQVRKLMFLFQPANMQSLHPPPVEYREDWYPPPGQLPYDDRYGPVQVANPPQMHPEDPYRSGQSTWAPPPVELRYTGLAPPANGLYPYAVQAPLSRSDSYVQSRVPGAIESQHVPHHLPPVDPYRSGQLARVAPPVEVRYAHLAPRSNDAYVQSQVPGAIEPQHVPQSVVIPYYTAPPIDPYRVEGVRAYQPENSRGAESVIRYRLVPERVPRDPLSVRDYKTVTASDGEVLQRNEQVDNQYNPERMVSSTHLASRSTHRPSGYDESSRVYADMASRPGTSSTPFPVSSRYSFAGVAPAGS